MPSETLTICYAAAEDLSVEGLRELRDQLQDDIRDTLNAFHQATGVTVSNVTVFTHDATAFDDSGSKRLMCYRVDATLEV